VHADPAKVDVIYNAVDFAQAQPTRSNASAGVIARLTESDPAALSLACPMELRIVPLHVDGDGNDVITYAFAPALPS